MTDVGNGWYRCSLTVLSDGTPGTSSYFYATSATTSGAGAYVGTGAIDTYYWGLQVEIGSFPSSFMPSDTGFASRSSIATYHDETGILRKAPVNGARHGYKYDGRKWVETGLILENAATKLTTEVNKVGAGWAFEASYLGQVFVRNTTETTAPDGSYTAVKCDVTALGTDMTYSDFLYQPGQIWAGTTKTLSFFVKGTAGETISAKIDGAGGGGSFIDHTLTGGWDRISATYSYSSSYSVHGVARLGPRGLSGSSQGTARVWYVWGAQLEDSYSMSSYIYGAINTTRSADIDTSIANGITYTREDDAVYIDNMQYSDWYNREEGTYYLDFDSNATSDTEVIVLGQAGYPWILYKYLANQWKTYNGNNSIVTPMDSAINPSKGAISFGKTSGSSAQNGTAVLTNNSNLTQGVALSNMNTLDIGYGQHANVNTFNGTMKKISYYPIEMTSAELQALTENN